MRMVFLIVLKMYIGSIVSVFILFFLLLWIKYFLFDELYLLLDYWCFGVYLLKTQQNHQTLRWIDIQDEYILIMTRPHFHHYREILCYFFMLIDARLVLQQRRAFWHQGYQMDWRSWKSILIPLPNWEKNIQSWVRLVLFWFNLMARWSKDGYEVARYKI